MGTCCALYLQRAGFSVSLIDRQEPGAGCSYGNAGVIQVGACVPVATPAVLRNIPAMLLDPDGPLVLRWRYLPFVLPYLVRFALSAHPRRVEEISIALASLLARAKSAYDPIVRDAGAQRLVKNTGELYVYGTETSFRAGKQGHDIRRRRGVTVDDLSHDELRQLVPDLAPDLTFASYLPDCQSTVDPFNFTRTLAQAFADQGGTVLREDVKDLVVGAGGPVALITESNRHPVEALVLATGAWSKVWAAKLGARVPLDTERGYHVMFTEPGIDLQVPVLSGDHRFAMTPMTGGIRLAGTAELAGLDAPPRFERIDTLTQVAKRLFPGLSPRASQQWMGHRPSTPDSLPVLGRSADFRDTYFAFGHGHLGLTLGAVTGELIADLALGRIGDGDLTAFRAERF